MRISHEVPIQLLEQSQSFNDYDYALAHLMLKYMAGDKKYEPYYMYYMSLPKSRNVYLDNSAFELGQSVEPELFAHLVEMMNPSLFFIPDKVDDFDTSMDMFEDWMKNFDHIAGKFPLRCMALQGDNIDELIKHYDLIRKYVSVVGVSYNYEFYDSDPKIRTISRMGVVRSLLQHDPQMRIHLLGCQSYVEFLKHRYPPNVISVDTSLPVMAALDGVIYPPSRTTHKAYYKSPHKLADNLFLHVSTTEQTNIAHNVSIFRHAVLNGEHQ